MFLDTVYNTQRSCYHKNNCMETLGRIRFGMEETMKYGYFDDLNREYVIDRPDTRPLGSTT